MGGRTLAKLTVVGGTQQAVLLFEVFATLAHIRKSKRLQEERKGDRKFLEGSS